MSALIRHIFPVNSTFKRLIYNIRFVFGNRVLILPVYVHGFWCLPCTVYRDYHVTVMLDFIAALCGILFYKVYSFFNYVVYNYISFVSFMKFGPWLL